MAISTTDVFQVFKTCSKENLTSSIQWYHWISDTSYYSPQKCRKPPQIGFFISNSNRDSLRNVFQVFQTGSKYNSTSSMQWYNQISDNLYYSPKKRRKPSKIVFFQQCHISSNLEMPLSPPREMPPLSQETRVWVWGMHISESDLTSPVADGRIS